MQIKFLENTYIRKSPKVDDSPVGVVYKGAVIDAEPVLVQGEEIDENDRWYCDKNGWYYWSGRTLIIRFGHTLPPGKRNIVRDRGEEEVLEAFPAEKDETKPGNSDAGSSVKPHQKLEEDINLPPPRFNQAVIDISNEEPPSSSSPSMVASDQSAIWKTDQKDRLNWGVKNYSIAEDWWNAHGLTGKGVRLAILSTGAATDHPDLSNITELLQNESSKLSMEDTDGLGTQAAIIAAGSGQKIFGVAPEAELLLAKLGAQDYLITPESLMRAFSWAIDNRADIIAVLVDFPSLPPPQLKTMEELCTEASNRNIWVLAPVGNSSSKRPEDRYPAAFHSVFSIGAHDQFGVRSAFSAKSYNLDISAPGEALLTSNPNQETVHNSKSVSIAVAFTAGFLALIRQSDHLSDQSNEQLFKLLRETAVSRRSFTKGEDTEYGYGLLNPIEILKRINPNYEGPSNKP